MSDAMAVGVFSAVRRLGLRVPDDVSVVGFDDIELSQYTDPPLTTIHQPTRHKGEEAIRLLLEGPVRRDDGRRVRRLLETRLAIRGSTRAPVGVATVRGGQRRAGQGGPAGVDPIGTGARVTEESMQQT
jgi:DNA-binding LacI/PurR family transcriptional regulator